MIGKIITLPTVGVALVPPVGYHVVKATRPAKIATMSLHTALLRSAARHNKPRGKPQWLRRLAGAYERGEVGISKCYDDSTTSVFTYHVAGRITNKLINR